MGRKPREDDEQQVMFPELSDSPEHKAIVKQARQLLKLREKRKEALVESKAQEDEMQIKLVAAMHAANVERFNCDGLKVEIKKNTEKVKVKLEAGDDDEEEGAQEAD